MTTAQCTRLALLAIFLGALPHPASAQGSDAIFSDSVEVEVVNVEVVVTDKEGRPVTGLTADDFTLLIDGAPVEITNFYEVDDGPSVGVVEAEAEEPEASNRPEGGTRGLNLVIFVDNLSIMPSNRKLLFDNLREYLRQGRQGIDQAMVVSMQNRVEVTQPFTTDMEAVMAALDIIEKQTSFQAAMAGEQNIYLGRVERANIGGGGGGTGVPGGGPLGGGAFDSSIATALDLALTSRTIAERRYTALQASISALSAFSSTLGGLPGRKAMIYLSDGLSVRPGDMLREAWAKKFERWYYANEDAIRNSRNFPDAAGVFQRMLTGLGSSEFAIDDELEAFTAHASDNQVALYPISVSGRGSSVISAESSGASGSSAVLRAARTTETFNRDSSMLQMADDTGGRAITTSPNIGRLLRQINDDFGYYYSLGYQPSSKHDSEFHRIEVEVSRADAETRHSKGFRRKSWRDRLGDMTAAAALFSIQTNPLDVRLTPGEQVRQGKRYKVPVMVQIPFRNVQMVSDGSVYSAQLTVLVMVSDGEGGLTEPQRFDLPIQIPNAQILAARAQAAAYPVELIMEPGQQQVAVSVRDHLAQTASVVSIPLEVGDGESKAKKKRRRG